MTDKAHEGYAVLAENGNFWSENCGEEIRGQLRIYEKADQAEKHRVADTDRIVKVLILIAD